MNNPLALKIVILALISTLISACGGNKTPEIPYREGAVVLSVEGMHCSNCEGTIMTALSKIKDLEWARAENDLGEVAYTGNVDQATVVKAIQDAGFQVAP